MEFDAVVLAGGTGRRLGGLDKAALRVGGLSLLDRALLACAAATRTVVVGEPRPCLRPVAWTLEEPPGGGPLAGLDAGLALTASGVVVVLATDLPRLTPHDVGRLLATLAPGADGVMFTDAAGRDQPLAAAYRRAPLAAAIDAEQPVTGRPVRSLLPHLRLVTVPDGGAAADCDTPEQLAAARRELEAR